MVRRARPKGWDLARISCPQRVASGSLLYPTQTTLLVMLSSSGGPYTPAEAEPRVGVGAMVRTILVPVDGSALSERGEVRHHVGGDVVGPEAIEEDQEVASWWCG